MSDVSTTGPARLRTGRTGVPVVTPSPLSGPVTEPRSTRGSGSGAGRDGKKRPLSRSGAAELRQLRRRQWSVVPVAGLALATGLAYQRVFGLREVLPVAAIAATAPAALAFLWSGTGRAGRPGRRPRPLLLSLLLSLAAWLVAVSSTLYRDAAVLHALPNSGLLRRIGGDMIDAPRGILTTVLPADGDARLLVLVSAGTWIAAFAGTELALRTGTVVLPALPGLLVLAVPVALSTGAPGDNVRTIAGAVGATALLAACRAPGRRSPLRALAVGLPLTLSLAVLTAFAAPQVPGVGSPPDLRDQVSLAPPVRLVGVNPLDRVSAWLLTPDQPFFTVQGAAEADRYWRMVVCDQYDGVSWEPSGGLRPTGGRVPEGPDLETAQSRSEMRVTLDKLDGVWLPAADRPEQVSVPADVDLAVDPGSGILATEGGLRPGLQYKVLSRIPEYDPDKLQDMVLANAPRYTALPERDATGAPIPDIDEFRRLAIEATAGASFPYQQALRLADWLRKNHEYDVTAVPGHSLRNLRFFLESSKEGTSEQFAAAFAVLARSIGLPTRVVVGFSRGTSVGPDTWRVDSGDVIAWPEVEFAGAGWVPFFPTPGEAGHSGAPKNDPGNPSAVTPQPTPVEPAPVEPGRAEKDEAILEQDRQTAAGPVPGSDGDARFAVWWWAVPAALVLLLAAAQVGLAAATPGVVRRRRRRGPPNQQVFGAWRQVRDRLAEIGMPSHGALTAREVAAYGEEHLPEPVGPRLRRLAALVNDVAFAGRTAASPDADEAWQTCAAVEEAVRGSAERPRRRTRLRQRLSPVRIVAALRRDRVE
ncbi:DUF3488 and transglutaminase-like domain-containing protein [Streptomycetaceae bacterium NBC_01309]